MDIEGTVVSPAVSFQRLHNLEKIVMDNLPLTGNVQYISGKSEIYLSEYVVARKLGKKLHQTLSE